MSKHQCFLMGFSNIVNGIPDFSKWCLGCVHVNGPRDRENNLHRRKQRERERERDEKINGVMGEGR